MENISGGPGGGCDGPTYTVFTEVKNFRRTLTFSAQLLFLTAVDVHSLGEQVPGLGGRTVWNGLPTLKAKMVYLL